MSECAKVLVIDDEAAVRQSIAAYLEDSGFETVQAGDGRAGVACIGRDNPDVVLCDLRMPGMDGIEVAERIKAKCPWTPVVVITGYGTDENEARASVLGVSGFVRKPLTPAMIENITLKALEEPAPAIEAANEPEAPAEAVAEVSSSALQTTGRIAKNIGLFIAAPFIALAYVIALPVVGFYMFAKLGIEAYQKKKSSS